MGKPPKGGKPMHHCRKSVNIPQPKTNEFIFVTDELAVNSSVSQQI
jgi:hypothetical protein